MNTDEYYDEYDEFNEEYQAETMDRQARRKQRPHVAHKPKKSQREILNDIAETSGLEGGLETTYTPARHEKWWLEESLRPFYDNELIDDVLSLVKGGKEANVYRCSAHAASGETYLAAKVYRPRMFRNLRNDQQYRQGRPALSVDGNPVKATDARVLRALSKGTAYGKQLSHSSWILYEFKTLETLFAAGAAVPRPFAVADNAIMMSFVGDGNLAAPTLNQVNLAPEEARPLFREVMRNIVLMLRAGRIHGDLSAYNILYWNGRITLIDFPQVVNSRVSGETKHVTDSQVNPDAYEILERDITRVCDYFSAQGVASRPATILDDLWSRFSEENPSNKLADASAWEVEE